MEEATQMVCQNLGAPVCMLSVADEQHEILKAATGLTQFGLMNPLSQSRQLALGDSFAPYILDSGQALLIDDIADYPALASTLLAQYGVMAYAGVPLKSSCGHCIGVFAIMDFIPRRFTLQEKTFL
ncbi:histidine kinase, partial [filamentous cyanobacterium CCP5]